MAQLVGHQAVMQEVESLTLARPTRRVLKLLSRKCCLCNYVSKWLAFQVFSDKDCKLEVQSHNPIRKRVGHRVPSVVVWPLPKSKTSGLAAVLPGGSPII